jgi:tRNA G10  N-methylase Trm11
MKQKVNYEDYSSGRVLYGAPGATNFPVSLTLEIFEKCSEYLTKKGNSGPYIIYDPFCGVAYSLTVLGLLRGENIKEIFASDIDKTILEFAHKNLSLLTIKGINHRIVELEKFTQEYKKDSHKEALMSAEKLKTKIQNLSIKIEEFQFNILNDTSLPKQVSKIDMVITDVPYGKLTKWEALKEGMNPIQIFLNKIHDRLSEGAIVAVVLNKKQEILYESYTKIKSFKSGKRKVVFVNPARGVLAGS